MADDAHKAFSFILARNVPALMHLYMTAFQYHMQHSKLK